MVIKPIRTKADHEAALREIERLWGADEGTPEGDRLDVLATLVEAYEQAHFPMDAPDPIEAIKFRLEQQRNRKSGDRSEKKEVWSKTAED
jgi:HTH-type transcriptional regulator/antitoxin HigA